MLAKTQINVSLKRQFWKFIHSMLFTPDKVTHAIWIKKTSFQMEMHV